MNAGEINVNCSTDHSLHTDTTIDAIASAVPMRQPPPPMSGSSVDDGWQLQRLFSAHNNAVRGSDLKAGVTATAAHHNLVWTDLWLPPCT